MCGENAQGKSQRLFQSKTARLDCVSQRKTVDWVNWIYVGFRVEHGGTGLSSTHAVAAYISFVYGEKEERTSCALVASSHFMVHDGT